MKKFNILILIIALLLPTSIYAAFFDTEKSINNTFSAAILDIKFNTTFVPSFPLSSKSIQTINTYLVNAGTLPSTNSLKFQYVKGDKELTEKIKLDVSGDVSYTGTLSNLNISGVELEAGKNKNINFTLSISPEDAEKYQGKQVTFNIFDLGVQDTSIYPHGFYDSEILTFTISIPAISIPKSESPSLLYTPIPSTDTPEVKQELDPPQEIIMCTEVQKEESADESIQELEETIINEEDI